MSSSSSTPGGTYRSISTRSRSHEVDPELQNLVSSIANLDFSTFDTLQNALLDTAVLQRLRHTLIDHSEQKQVKDAFRRCHGFSALVNLLHGLATCYSPQLGRDDRRAFFAYLKETLGILGESLRDHLGNRSYISRYGEECGWTKYSEELQSINEQLFHNVHGEPDVEQFYGVLLCTAVGEDSVADVFTDLRKGAARDKTKASEAALLQQRRQLEKAIGDQIVLENPDVITMMLRLWGSFRRSEAGKNVAQSSLGTAIPQCLLILLHGSRQNNVALHTSGSLSLLLPLLFDGDLSPLERPLYREAALYLCKYGLGNLEDGVFIYSRAIDSPDVANFLLEALRRSRQPASIQFDLTLQGFASCELRSLGQQFPPMHSAGYTLSMWVRFDSFDLNTHTTLFGAFDASQTCFLLAYIEKDTHNLILQTSIKGSRPSVRFRSFKFDVDRWYHLCVVHRRPRTTSSPKASLIVDGEFYEQQKLRYPDPPPSIGHKDPRVQAFLGTPQDLSTEANERKHPDSKWSVASTTLFAEAFSDDLCSVFYHLGPRYHGNFQDCLGSFQTYSASAALNVRNESLHPGKEEHSDIVSAIRNKASLLIPESCILLNISPLAVLDNEDRNNVDESELVKSLSRSAAKTLRHYIRLGANAVAVNGAVPAINDALTHSHGIGVLTGSYLVSVPQALDDAAWRIGGCTGVALSMVNAATSPESLLQAVKIMFEMVRDNWRNSEAIEKDNGYGILSVILRSKLFSFSSGPRTGPALSLAPEARSGLFLGLLNSILEFVGYDEQQPQKSLLNNPLAYRTLLVDNDIWRQGDLEVQMLYYKQFVVFASESQHSRFNVKRLVRMRIVKKWLEALKGQSVSADILPSFLGAFKALLMQNPSTELLRALALFITYALHKDIKGKGLRAKRSTRGSTRPRGDSQSSFAEVQSDVLTKQQLGIEMLRLYTGILCKKEDVNIVKKFARTVTNKWVLYLMSEPDPEVVVLGTRILARLLVVHGSSYVKKFAERSGGFCIMRYRLRRWWHLPSLWSLCFAILFDLDVAQVDFDRAFDLFSFLDVFDSQGGARITNGGIWMVIMGMLQSGIKAVVLADKADRQAPRFDNSLTTPVPTSQHRLSMSSITSFDASLKLGKNQVETLNTVIRFLADMHSRSPTFRDWAASSDYVESLLSVLFPVVVGSDTVGADVELNARDSKLSFDPTDMIVRPLPSAPPVVRTAHADPPLSPRSDANLKRGSSFILVTSEASRHQPSTSRLHPSITPLSPVGKAPKLNDSSAIVQSFLEIIVSIFVDQILCRKDFSGLGLFAKTPPAFVEHQTYFESWVLRNTLSELSNTLLLDQKLLWEPRVLTNLARFFTHIGEALYEGWFVGGADAALDFAGSVLEYLQRPDISKIKSVRLCSRAISDIRTVVFKTILLSLSQVDNAEHLAFLNKLAYWQTVLLASEDTSASHLQSICYLLYTGLISTETPVREAAANLWRIILVQKPEQMSSVLDATSAEYQELTSGFQKLVELDNETFLYWIDEHREQLDSLFFGSLSRRWDMYVSEENAATENSAKQRLNRRREKLKEWYKEEKKIEDTISRHESSFALWTLNIFTSENLKHQRSLQDQQDNTSFAVSSLIKIARDIERPNGLLAKSLHTKWRLDQTEGRNRMRLRITPDTETAQEQVYQPKRKVSESASLKLKTTMSSVNISDPVSATTLQATPQEGIGSEPFPELSNTGEEQIDAGDMDESFELIEEPTVDEEAYEDKNRKVMRSLHRGDQVQQVANISRIVGLEAVEGLLILGKDHIYLIDNFFQRSDGEIVNVWQASDEERDQYVRMIAGREASTKRQSTSQTDHETRSWKWDDVISVSKRRFLFRDVALEIFFSDGRSYLLTVMGSSLRDNLHGLIIAKSPQYTGPSSTIRSEDAWRYETLRSPDDQPQSIGYKFANVFSQASSNPATRKWMKGELSNFHYLMLINTMAGRTFNDLTQYPVFPWVLADYESEELDLTNPKTFRDLSKPMGCQTSEREADFRERYKSFAEMGDDNAPPFHYGTHYSSAMIVTSYLIRLQPFVKSYLLLQGGSFDHADRMFYSVAKAWHSASKTNMTDVRELIPEFYYLPEFLENLNKYDFGARQGTTKSVDAVDLPPWAKGDPKIFITKHREALESPYVSENLHKWIDLVFGFKQKGDAAVDAVNVFHHLSYQGAKDLDTIEDQMERLATIGIIHNFGQTPFQVFQKSHPAREEVHHRYKRLDSAAESLTRVPFPLLDSAEHVTSLSFSHKQERLLCSAGFRLNIPPTFERYMDWGFFDGSVRFYNADSKKLIGHAEHLHIGQLSAAIFADSRTLITSGTDCTVSVWTLVVSGKSVELLPKACFLGHRKPVTLFTLSRSFGTLLSVSTDGEIMIWDLNRLEFVRKLDRLVGVMCARINDVTGNIVLCQGSRILLYTLNGALLLSQQTGPPDDTILSCAFYEGAGNEWLERDILLTGHRRGVVKIWSKVVRGSQFELESIRQLNHIDNSREDGANVNAGISCILPMPQMVYTGDEDGKVKPGNLDFDARVPIPISVFPSTYRNDAAQESTTDFQEKVEVDLKASRVGREDTRYSKEKVDIYESQRPRREEDIKIYEERETRYPEVELTRERYQAPPGVSRGADAYRDSEVDIGVDRRRVYQHQPPQVYDRVPHESQIDITEREYRRRVNPAYDIEIERRTTVPREEVIIEKDIETTAPLPAKHKRGMGYYDDEGHYHSFRRGLERAADRVFHPFHPHGTEEIIMKEEGAPRVRETVRYVEPRGGIPPDTISIPCHFIRIGDLLILQGRPCQVIRISTSPQTGQHRYLGVDLFTRQLHEESSFISKPAPSVVVQSMLGPVYKQYRILDITDDGRLTAMTETGDVKSELSVIEQGSLFSKIQRAFSDGRGSVRALVINDGGYELVVDYKVVHGSRL